MLAVQIGPEAIRIGEDFTVSFKRTLRVPDDGKKHKTPPNFGVFPIYRVDDYAESLPEDWLGIGGAFIPMFQAEALYLRFENAAPWQPYAVKVGIGRINALSGRTFSNKLHNDPQDYLVCPPQLWLDGINTGQSNVRQFVAMPLGEGYSVEASLTGKEEFGGLQITVFAPKPGIFPDAPPQASPQTRPTSFGRGPAASASMGLGAGGTIKEKILPDPHGRGTWDTDNFVQVNVHLFNSAQFQRVAGLEPPATTVNEKIYAEHKFPWFPLYGEGVQGDVEASNLLAEAKTILEREAELKNKESGTNSS